MTVTVTVWVGQTMGFHMDSSRERPHEGVIQRGVGGVEIECHVAPTYPLCDDSLSLTWDTRDVSGRERERVSRNRQILETRHGWIMDGQER